MVIHFILSWLNILVNKRRLFNYILDTFKYTSYHTSKFDKSEATSINMIVVAYRGALILNQWVKKEDLFKY